MKQAVVLVLLAAAAIAEEPGLRVQVALAVETLSEGERAVAKFHLKNEGTSPIVLLTIEPDDGIETRGGELSDCLRAAGVEVAPDAASFKVTSLPAEAAQVPEVFPYFRSLVRLEPGAEVDHEVVLKAPTGHVYAVHFSVYHVTLDQAVEQGAVYCLDEKATAEDAQTYRRADGVEAIRGTSFVRLERLPFLPSTHAAIAVEVKPRDFSFAQAAKEFGAVPDAATWFEARGVWALGAKGKTLLVGPDTRIELNGEYVPLLSALSLEDRDTLALPAPAEEDPLGAFLREKGATDVSGKGDRTLLLVQVRDLPEVLQKADELGLEVTRDGWKKRQ